MLCIGKIRAVNVEATSQHCTVFSCEYRLMLAGLLHLTTRRITSQGVSIDRLDLITRSVSEWRGASFMWRLAPCALIASTSHSSRANLHTRPNGNIEASQCELGINAAGADRYDTDEVHTMQCIPVRTTQDGQ